MPGPEEPPVRELLALNEPQASAVAKSHGPLLVFAGAGSGKTRVITYRVAHLLSEHRVPAYRILTVTFTNKAAGELKARLTRLAGTEVTADLWVGTFHAVCARLLRRHHREVGLGQNFSIYDDSDQKAVVSRVLKELAIDEQKLPPKLALGRIQAEKREGRGPADMQVEGSFEGTIQAIFSRYQAALSAANAADFEDLIALVVRLGEDPESPAGDDLRRRFDHVLVDEFQDTNLVQYRLVKALTCRTRNLCVVGDDDQSIYRWRGADVRIIRGFRRDFPDATVVKLEQNYRSTGNIVQAALGVIAASRQREPKVLWTASLAGDPVRVRAVTDERDEARFVVRTIESELARGTDARNLAVFYRIHAQSRVLEEALRSANRPYQIVGGMKFFERAEVKDLLSYLRLVDNPRSLADLLRIINVPTRGIGDKTVEQLLATMERERVTAIEAIEILLDRPGLGTGPKNKLRGFFGLIQSWIELGKSVLPHVLGERILEESGYDRWLRKLDTAEADARLENLHELIGSIMEYEGDAERAGEHPSLALYLERVSLVTSVDSMKDVPAVNLMTVHAAKGLEFTTVLLTGMEEEVFPYRGLDADDAEDLEEERRLMYVAMTRARERLFITHAAQRTLFGRSRYTEPSRFLADLPREAVEHEGGGASRSLRPSWSPRASAVPGERVVDRSAFDDLPPEEGALRRGARVWHKQFGQGVVERVEHGPPAIVIAYFDGFGSRRILAEYLGPGD
jgi:DNA helicase II / ATP-dependent DNA helicase PcrA